jgi:hypothetical protein
MEGDVKLSRSARQDVGRLCLVSLLSTGFFATPLILAEDPLPPVPPRAPVEAAAPSVTVVTTQVSAEVSMPELATPVNAMHVTARSARQARPLGTSFSRDAAPSAERDTQLRRLGRWLAGDGRYTVRPFPTIDQE